MASSAGLKITIGADVSQAVRSIAALEAELKQLKADLSVSTSPAGIVSLNKEIKALETTIKNAKSAENISALNTSLTKLAPGANQAGLALTNLGRVAQDAPFGFIGIQNNINPLLESFQQLKAQTGSTVGAFKALGQSLIGAAGVGLAISVVTSLITAAIQKYGSLSNALDVVFGLTTNLAQANRQLAKSFADSEGSVAGEIANIQSLVSIAQNKALADGTRQQAIDKLNKAYDEYLPKLTLETVNTDLANDAVKRLTNSLIRQAKTKGLQDIITKGETERINALVKSGSEYAGVLSTIKAAAKAAFTPTGSDFGLKLTSEGVAERAKDLQKIGVASQVAKDALQALNEEEAKAKTLVPDGKEKKIKAETDELGKKLALLEKIAAIQQKEVDIPTVDKKFIGFEIDGLTEKEIEDLTGVRKIEQALRDVDALMKTSEKIYALRIDKINLDKKKKLIGEDEAKLLRQQAEDELSKVFVAQALVLEGSIRVQPSLTMERVNLDTGEIASKIAKETGLDKKIPIPIEFEINVKLFGEEMAREIAETQKRIAEFKKYLTDTITTGVSDSFALLGESLGEAIAGANIGDVLAKAAQGFLSIVGNVLSEVGKQIIVTSKLVIALKAALSKAFSNPAASLVVGIALVAAGAALKNIKFNVPKMQQGGILTGPRTVIAGEAGNEAIIPLDKLPSMINAAGGSNVTLQGNLRIGLRDLYLELQRVGNANSRTNK